MSQQGLSRKGFPIECGFRPDGSSAKISQATIEFLEDHCRNPRDVMGTDGWSVVVSTEKYSVSRRKIENQPVELVSGRFRMSIPPSRAFDIFYDPALRQQWDTNTTDFEIVDKIDDRNDVLLQRGSGCEVAEELGLLLGRRFDLTPRLRAVA